MLSSGSIPWHNGRYVTPFPSPTHSFFIFARRKGVLASRPLEEKVRGPWRLNPRRPRAACVLHGGAVGLWSAAAEATPIQRWTVRRIADVQHHQARVLNWNVSESHPLGRFS